MTSKDISHIQPSAPLELDPKHPGINDSAYVARRQDLFNMAYAYRIAEKGWPTVDYTEAEHALWRQVSQNLEEIHQRSACALYLQGKRQLQIESRFMPQLGALDARLRAEHNFGLVPAEGLLEGRLFFQYLRQRRMPCTQFLRHHAVPQFTPEPDAIHDVIGHVPCLMDAQYNEIVQQIGEGLLACADKEKSAAWGRLYWFTIEFGLIEDAGQIKVFGSGILSSLEEMEYCLSDAVNARPFVLEDVINQPYDPSRMQDNIFVVPSLAKLAEDISSLRKMTS